MSFLEWMLVALVVYYLAYVVLWFVLDCNAELWLKESFGVPISTMRGHVVWITGASSGIGRALAVKLASYGVKIVLSARRERQLEEVREECLQHSHGLLANNDVLVLPLDMLETGRHQECLDRVIAHFGHLDVLVNNAGRSQRANWQDIDVQVDRDLFELDVFAVMSLSRIVVKYFMRERSGRGHIAATSSVAGFVPVPFSATYCAAKHALNAYFRALQVEQRAINVTIFSPGPIATDFLEEAFTDMPGAKVGQSTKNQKRMTVERCGYLFAVSLANKLQFSWCGLFPVNLLAYFAQYTVLSKLTLLLLNEKTMSKIREGKV